MEDRIAGWPPPLEKTHAADAVRSSAIVLLGLAVPATLFLSFWTTAPLPVIGAIAVLWVAGLGLLTRSPVGVWLGRLGATVLLLAGVYVAWYSLFSGEEAGWGLQLVVVIVGVTLATLFGGAGIGVLWALRPRTRVHQEGASVLGDPRHRA
jgi:hypothetical protein